MSNHESCRRTEARLRHQLTEAQAVIKTQTGRLQTLSDENKHLTMKLSQMGKARHVLQEEPVSVPIPTVEYHLNHIPLHFHNHTSSTRHHGGTFQYPVPKNVGTNPNAPMFLTRAVTKCRDALTVASSALKGSPTRLCSELPMELPLGVARGTFIVRAPLNEYMLTVDSYGRWNKRGATCCYSTGSSVLEHEGVNYKVHFIRNRHVFTPSLCFSRRIFTYRTVEDEVLMSAVSYEWLDGNIQSIDPEAFEELPSKRPRIYSLAIEEEGEIVIPVLHEGDDDGEIDDAENRMQTTVVI